MNQRSKRAAALLLALLMTLSLVQQRGTAVLEGVYFSAANEQLMPLNDETMPFYSGSTLYVCQTLFDGTDLGVRYIRNYSMGLAVLYTSTTDLRFDLTSRSISDKYGNPYPGKAIEKNGYLFFPLELVCRFFDLDWSITDTATVPLVRITSDTAYLDDQSFISAAASMMAGRYAAYEKQVKDNQTPPDDGNSEPTPDDVPDITPPPIHAAAGQKLFLILRGTSESSIRAAMQALDGSSVTFLLTAEQMENGNLLRALLGSGHAVALHVQGSTESEIRAEILHTRELVRAASYSLLQLVWYEGGLDISALLQEQGLVHITATLDHSKLYLRTSSDAETLLHLIGKHREDLSVFLGDDESCTEGLDTLLTQLSEAKYRLCAWRLTH